MNRNRIPVWSDDAPATDSTVVDTKHSSRKATGLVVALCLTVVLAILAAANWNAINAFPGKAVDWALNPLQDDPQYIQNHPIDPSSRLSQRSAGEHRTPSTEDASTSATTSTTSAFDTSFSDDEQSTPTCTNSAGEWAPCTVPPSVCQFNNGEWARCSSENSSTKGGGPIAPPYEAPTECRWEHGQTICTPQDSKFGEQIISCLPTGNLMFTASDDWMLTCQLDDRSMLRINKYPDHVSFVYDDPYRTVELHIYKYAPTTTLYTPRTDADDRSYMMANQEYTARTYCDLQLVNQATDTVQDCTVLIQGLPDFKIVRTIDTERSGAKHVSLHIQAVGYFWSYFRIGLGDVFSNSTSAAFQGGYVPN